MSAYCEREACVNHHIRKEGFWVHDNGDGAYRLGPKKGRSAVRGVRAARMFASFMGGRVVHVIAKEQGR